MELRQECEELMISSVGSLSSFFLHFCFVCFAFAYHKWSFMRGEWSGIAGQYLLIGRLGLVHLETSEPKQSCLPQACLWTVTNRYPPMSTLLGIEMVLSHLRCNTVINAETHPVWLSGTYINNTMSCINKTFLRNGICFGIASNFSFTVCRQLMQKLYLGNCSQRTVKVEEKSAGAGLQSR